MSVHWRAQCHAKWLRGDRGFHCCSASWSCKFIQVFDTLKIPAHCFGTRDTLEKGNMPDPFVRTFSFVMPFSHESEHTTLMTSLIINLSLATFHRQSLPWEGLNEPRGDPDSSSSSHFSLCPPRPVSSASFFCEASYSIFRVRLRPHQSLRTVWFWMFVVDFFGWFKNRSSNEEMKMFRVVRVVRRPIGVPMDGPHAKCSPCYTFLCIVATPQFRITQCLAC